MKRFIPKPVIFLLVAVLLLGAGAAAVPHLLKKRMNDTLARYGVGGAVITALSRERGEIMFSGIRLDRDGFSTIESIRARMNWPALLAGDPFSELVIDNLHLTGKLDDDGKLAIDGWKPAAAFPLAETDSVILNGGRLDLDTPAGGIRLEAKGRAARRPDGGQKVEAALWGKQAQLIIDTRWDAGFAPGGSWNASADIREGRLALERVEATRVTGWISFERQAGAAFPLLAGQLAAGQLRLGAATILANAAVTIDGPLDRWHIILQGEGAGGRGLSLTADLRRTDKGLLINAVAESQSLDDLFGFMVDLNNDMHYLSAGMAGLTTLLITPGNLDRIRREVKKQKYDSLELAMDGTAYDLTGKIVLKRMKDGVMEKSVISMNPAAERL